MIVDNNIKDPSGNDDNNHQIPEAGEVDEGGEEESQFEEPIASPEVTGEENVFSGDAPEGEPADIDEEMKKVGLEKEDHEDPDNF